MECRAAGNPLGSELGGPAESPPAPAKANLMVGRPCPFPLRSRICYSSSATWTEGGGSAKGQSDGLADPPWTGVPSLFPREERAPAQKLVMSFPPIHLTPGTKACTDCVMRGVLSPEPTHPLAAN